MILRSSGCSYALAFALASGLASAWAHGEVNTRLEYQVSPALAETWSSSINAQPGASIDIRIRASYIGTQQPLGMGAIMYQPTVSNWDNAGLSRDALAPIAIGKGDASTSGPYGSVPDAPGLYGRIFGFARTHNSGGGGNTVPADVGHMQVHNGVSYLRIAKSNVTNWWAGAGSPTGGGGIDTAQWTPGFRPDTALPFDTRLADIVVFKFSITLSADTDLRTLIATTPQELLSYWDSGFTQARGRWVANTTEVTGSIRGEYLVLPATINVVPSPGVLAVAAVGLLAARRRR
jgi:hypothetical protein